MCRVIQLYIDRQVIQLYNLFVGRICFEQPISISFEKEGLLMKRLPDAEFDVMACNELTRADCEELISWARAKEAECPDERQH